MKKNTFIRVLSLTMAAGVILGSYGCKDTKTSEETTKAAEGNSNVSVSTSELSSITTVIEYTSVNKKGKEKNATSVATIVDPGINKAHFGPLLSEKFSDDKNAKDNFKKKVDTYSIDEKKADEIIKDAENWQTFTYDYFVSNPFSKRIAFRTISSTPKDGIILDGDIGCEKGVPSGVGTYIILEGLVDTNKYKDEDAIKAALKEMKPQIEYTFVDGMDDTIDDWSAVKTKQLPIDISR